MININLGKAAAIAIVLEKEIIIRYSDINDIIVRMLGMDFCIKQSISCETFSTSGVWVIGTSEWFNNFKDKLYSIVDELKTKQSWGLVYKKEGDSYSTQEIYDYFQKQQKNRKVGNEELEQSESCEQLRTSILQRVEELKKTGLSKVKNNKGNRWKDTASVLKQMIESRKIHERTVERLSGNWIKRGILTIDKGGRRHLIIDDGKALIMENIRLEYMIEPLSELARLLSEQQLILLDRQMMSRNVMLSASRALQYIKESGLQVASTDGTIYRYQNGLILQEKDTIGTILEGEYLTETALLLFSSLDTQPVQSDSEQCRAMKDTKEALPG